MRLKHWDAEESLVKLPYPFTMSSCLRNVHGSGMALFSTEIRTLQVQCLFQFEQSVAHVHIKAQVSRCRLVAASGRHLQRSMQYIRVRASISAVYFYAWIVDPMPFTHAQSRWHFLGNFPFFSFL
jgi:hypothetical protein